MTAYSRAAVEFPDYPQADLPAMPEGFEDTSWHNDACPSISNGSLVVWIDYVDAARRELDGASRFTVRPLDDDDAADIYSGDDWDAVLAAIAK